MKLRQTYGDNGCDPNPYLSISSGLYNSVKFLEERLRQLGIHANIAQVNDANDIDKEVHRHRPTSVILEAVWCPPEKFEALLPLHPNVEWTVRVHSEIPFLANEGMSIKWLMTYILFEKVSISCNSIRATEDLRVAVRSAHPDWNEAKIRQKVMYLPNYYPTDVVGNDEHKPGTHLNVACFGAIRPMKNQLIQAFAAVDLAAKMKKKLRFYVNGTRIEQSGENVLKNLQSLMDTTGNHLVREDWKEHKEFIKVLKHMDLGMQVSLSETFNIVSADMVVSGVPIVVSPEVFWATKQCQADPTDLKDIVKKAQDVLGYAKESIKKKNYAGLKRASEEAQELWLEYIKK